MRPVWVGGMTPADLRAWQAQLGYTYDTAAAALGVSRATYARWLAGSGDVPRTTALPCSALAAGLGPWCATATAATPTPRICPHPA